MRDIPDVIFNAQRWGGTVKAPTEGNDFQQVIKVALPREYTRAWALTFNAPLRADGGDPSVGPNGVGPVTTSPTPTAIPAALGAAPFNQLPYVGDAQVRLRYGESAAQSEEIYMDVPPRGAVYEFAAAFVELSIKDKGAVGVPAAHSVALNSAPGGARGRAASSGLFVEGMPTQTTDASGVLDAANDSMLFTLPRRAVAIRASAQAGIGTFAAGIRYDFYKGDGTFMVSYSVSQETSLKPIPPGAQWVSVFNSSGGAYTRCLVSFLLAL